MTPKLLTPEELKRIEATKGGGKRAANWDVYIDQLLAHIAALEDKHAKVTPANK